MIAEADARIHDANVIAESLVGRSDSSSLLKILALEVLLKAAQLHTTGKIKRSHNYLEIWSSLPAGARQTVLAVAESRYPGHTDLSHVEKLLCVYEFLFTKARYGYELYEKLSIAEQHELGEEWSSRGAPIEEADIQYFPLELSALLEGLRAVSSSAA